MSTRPYEVARLDEIEGLAPSESGLIMKPVRRTLGIQAFGVNAFTAEKAGDEVVEHHDETGSAAGRHEELYVVVSGHATFAVGEEEIDAPAGTLVFVRDPEVRRGATAREGGTVVLVVGGRPGEPFQESPWEYFAGAWADYRTGNYERAIDHMQTGIERFPGNWSALYNIACYEALAGRQEAALEHLRQAIELHPEARSYAKTDADFEPIRADPAFAELVGNSADETSA